MTRSAQTAAPHPAPHPAAARGLTLRHFRWVAGHADLWRVLREPAALRELVRALAAPWREAGVTGVVGIESRGFLLGGAVAVELGTGFVAVRKEQGLFAGEKASTRTAPDYRGCEHVLRLRREDVRAGDRLLLVDDWIETGSQALAVRGLVEELGARWAGCSVLVDDMAEAAPGRREAVGPVRSVVRADELPEG